MESLQIELINFLIVVLTACIGAVTAYVTNYLKQKGIIAKVQNNKEVVGIIVNATEQMYKEFNGDEKLHYAKSEIAKLMKEKNIKISEKEINLFIESAVIEMNKTIKEEMKK